MKINERLTPRVSEYTENQKSNITVLKEVYESREFDNFPYDFLYTNETALLRITALQLCRH